MAFARTPVAGVEGASIVVAINAGEAPVTLELDLTGIAGNRLALLPLVDVPAAQADAVAIRDGRADVTVPARTGRIYQVDAS